MLKVRNINVFCQWRGGGGGGGGILVPMVTVVMKNLLATYSGSVESVCRKSCMYMYWVM